MTRVYTLPKCAECAAPLPLEAASHRKFCDGTCRKAAHDKRRRKERALLLARIAELEAVIAGTGLVTPEEIR